MKSLLDIVNLSTEFLTQKKIAHPRRQAEEIIADALGITRLQIYTDFERPLHPDELSICRERISRRAKGEPSQYIKGDVEFYNTTLHVNSHVLIPRQETEILVDKIANVLKNEDLEGKVLWDICTGSACIAIALKKKFPKLHVIASDLSLDALEVAKQNAENNQVEITFKAGNLLEPFKGEKCHYFVSNPPYITETDWQGLDTEVRNFEPKMALVGGNDGLAFYKAFAEFLPDHLYPSSKVWFEIGTAQGEDVKKIFSTAKWKNGVLEKDWAGHDRFFFLENE